MESAEDLDATRIREEAAALAAHLQRIGVRWLPACQPDVVEKLKLELDFAGSSEAPAAVAELPPTLERPSAIRQGAARREESTGQPATPAAAVVSKSNTNRPESNRPASRLTPVPAVAVSREPYPGETFSPEQRQAKLDALSLDVAACGRCEVLASCRKQTVFGEGPPQPRFVFFGEGPGGEEDLTGRPFVGRAGELLTKMIEACTLQRDDVYILNTVKCRPPGNRNPDPEELANCRPYYQTQLQILRPEYIVCLGAVSGQELLQSRLSVGRLRGTLHRYHDSHVLVTYHPAYLLRNPAAKKAAWQDLQLLMRNAGLASKSKR